MLQEARNYEVQVAVVGSGLAGFAASIFALERGLSTAQVGNTGAVAYTTGYLDLLGSHPVTGRQVLENPWAGLDALRRDEPRHPYSRLSNQEILDAFCRFTEAVSGMGVKYTRPGELNLSALTPAGTVKPTLSVPCTMLPGIEAHNANAKTHIADILGLNGFSANEVVANLKGSWSNLSAVNLHFPDMESGSQVYPEVMARALQVPAQRKEFALRLREAAGDAEYLGMPAIMGIHRPDEVHADLERLSGVRLFEIPTMPPSIAGIRLREMFEQVFPERGLVLVPQQKVEHLDLDATGGCLHLKDSYGAVAIRAETVILATGRFLSGGLQAGREHIREPLIGVPVSQPDGRAGWYRDRYFDPRGHQVNRAGIEVDERFRPLGEQGEPISERLFSAGILLAHQDWIRQRCGAGVAIASAYKAVAGVAELLG